MQNPCNKESFNTWKKSSTHGIFLAHPHGRHDVMWKRSIASCKKERCVRGSKPWNLICSASSYTCLTGVTIFTVGGWGTCTLDAMVTACRSKLSKVKYLPSTCATLIHQLFCPGRVFPYKRLMGMCRWMGSHFHDWIGYNGVAFSIEFTWTGSHIFWFWR